MKIKLSESKERIPAEFLTSLISKYWDEVSALKAEISAIDKDFVGTKDIKNAMQDLSDAYLIAIGRFQSYLEDKNILTIPTEETNESLKEDLDEDAHIDVDKVEINVQQPHVDVIKDDDDILAGEFDDDPAIEVRPVNNKPIEKSVVKELPKDTEEFDYFCDFEDADLDDRPITDAELYPEPKM